MATYGTNNRMAGSQSGITTTFKTLVNLSAATATLRRAQIIEFSFGADGSPNASDTQVVYDVSRSTAIGTGTSATPNPSDTADVASDTVATVNHTVEPTIAAAASLFSVALNQRASQRWVAPPGSELIIPATNLAGLAFRALSPVYASNILFQTYHQDI